MSNFVGDWAGYAEGPGNNARVLARIEGNAQRLEMTLIAVDTNGTTELGTLTGREETATAATFALVNYFSDKSRPAPVHRLTVTMALDAGTPAINGKWATNIGTFGTTFLRPAGGAAKALLSIPYPAHVAYRYCKRFLRRHLRYGYLIFVVALAALSIAGETPERISTVEAVLLLVPLVFLFRDKVLDLIRSMRIRKFGPVEFSEDQAPPKAGSINNPLQVLHNEFAPDLERLLLLARFFVPRTKYLLRLMQHFDKPLSPEAFRALATDAADVPADNIDATRTALISGGVIAPDDDGRYRLTPFGHRFLAFEQRAAQLLAGQ